VKISVFLGTTACGPVKANRRLGITGRLNLHGIRVSLERKQRKAGNRQNHGLVYFSTLK
jgi:hypothetical protein